MHDVVDLVAKLAKQDGRYKDIKCTNPTGMYTHDFINEVKENICAINNIKVSKINGKNCFSGIEIKEFNK